MKKLSRNLVLKLLTFLAKRRISPNTKIIGITGSVGKTTTKEAVVKILGSRFRIHANKKSFNSEFGIPLTLLEEESGFSSPFAWLGILFRSVKKSFHPLKMDYLILEMGVDKPRDMEALLKIIQPDIGIMLAVKKVHLAENQFSNLEAIVKEKGLLIANLPTDGVAILNQDDELIAGLNSPAKKVFIGIEKEANFHASEIVENLEGINAKIIAGENSVNLTTPILGKHHLYGLLAAIAVGREAGLSLEDCAKVLEDFHLPPGRLNLLRGVSNSRIIDGSYNSNPGSLEAALKTLEGIPTTGRKIALLGQMNELGEESEKLHREIGKQASKIVNEVIGVFGDAKYIVEEADKRDIPARYFENAETAGDYLLKNLQANDVVLVKGSQNSVRLEKAVAKILANEIDKALLCRQEAYWQKH